MVLKARGDCLLKCRENIKGIMVPFRNLAVKQIAGRVSIPSMAHPANLLVQMKIDCCEGSSGLKLKNGAEAL